MKNLFLFLLCTIALVNLYSLPHPVYIQLRNQENNPPAEGDIHCEACRTEEPHEFLTEESVDCYYPAFSDYLKINVDQFTSWEPGDTVHVDVWEISTLNWAALDFVVSVEPSQFFDEGEGGLYLGSYLPVISIEPPSQIQIASNEITTIDFSPFIAGNGISLNAQSTENIEIFISGFTVSLSPASNWTGIDSATFSITGLCNFEDSADSDIIVEHTPLTPDELPSKSANLLSIYPNPFNPQSSIHFSVDTPADVIIDIYDIKGRMIETLHNEYTSSGVHSVIWQAKDYPTGIYVVNLKIEGKTLQTRKISLIK